MPLAITTGEVLTAMRHIPAREAQWAAMPEWVRPELAAAYAAKGIKQLYTHQRAAADAVHAGRNVVVVTPTASGKTVCYNLPVINAVLENADTRALYLFPTKALAQDQLAELHDLAKRLDNAFGVFTYDGDTPADARKAIREKGHIVLSNPDMLHAGILPHHTRWQRLFENLRYIVLDELHTYRGVFGSHLCNVLRRLRRIAAFYGSKPQFICSSATIANPGELASKLIEENVEVLETNGAPAGEKVFVFYNPPVVNRYLGIRRSYINETSRLAQEFLKRGSADDGLREQPAAHRGAAHLFAAGLSRGSGRSNARARLSRRLSCPASAAKSSVECAKGAFAASFRRTRSSWASMSARSMRW